MKLTRLVPMLDVEDLDDLYRPLAEEAGLAFARQRTQTGPAVVRGDRDLLFQAMTNLLENAIKFSGDSGTVGLSLGQTGGAYELRVSDQGPGIPAEDRERVLERFTRLEASRTTRGTGLGLALVHAVSRLHQGALRLEDNRPGLRVTLTLPADPQASGDGQ